MTLRSLWWILLLVAALVLAIWWGRDAPALQAWLPEALRTLPATVQGAATSGAAKAAARKCQGAAQVVYTDGPCPAGLREAAMDGGSVSVLPAVRPPAAAEPAASAQTPLRRLAGPDDSAAQRERVLDQALHR
jgi:hypothetical protein